MTLTCPIRTHSGTFSSANGKRFYKAGPAYGHGIPSKSLPGLEPRDGKSWIQMYMMLPVTRVSKSLILLKLV